MAEAKGPRIRKTETSSSTKKAKSTSRGRKRKIKSPLSKFKPIKLPDNKLGRILSIIGRIIFPRFIRGAFSEIRQTTWPNRDETIRLTWAVFVFAIIFSIIVAALDFVLDKIFRSIILG